MQRCSIFYFQMFGRTWRQFKKTLYKCSHLFVYTPDLELVKTRPRLSTTQREMLP